MVLCWGYIPLAKEGKVHLLGRRSEPGSSRFCPGQAPAPAHTSSGAEPSPSRGSLRLLSPVGAGSAQARATTARRRAPRHTASAPLPPRADKSAPPRTPESGHAAAHTHLVREAPEVSHVPADLTGPSQPLRPLASSTCEKPQAAWSTAARGPVPWRPLHPRPPVPRPGPLTRPQGVPGFPNIQERPAGSAHLRAAPSRTPGPLRSPHGGSHRDSVSRNAQASQPWGGGSGSEQDVVASAKLCGTRSPAARLVSRARKIETTSPSRPRGRVPSYASALEALMASDYTSQESMRWAVSGEAQIRHGLDPNLEICPGWAAPPVRPRGVTGAARAHLP